MFNYELHKSKQKIWRFQSSQTEINFKIKKITPLKMSSKKRLINVYYAQLYLILKISIEQTSLNIKEHHTVITIIKNLIKKLNHLFMLFNVLSAQILQNR
jgi:hypothetical protein